MSLLSVATEWSKARRNLSESFQLVVGVLSIVLVWELFVQITNVNQVLLPSPSQIVVLSITEFDYFLNHSIVTVIEIFFGFWAGIIFGFLAAVGIYYVPFLRRGMYPVLAGVNQVPKISFAPLLLVWFGAGLVTNMIISMFIVFFPMMVNSFTGFDQADEHLIELTRMYEVEKSFVFRKIRLPAALPLMMTAMKLGTTLAVIGAIAAEFVSSSEGLGFVIMTSSSDLRTPRMFAGIVFTTIIALSLYGIVILIERRLLFWYEEQED